MSLHKLKLLNKINEQKEAYNYLIDLVKGKEKEFKDFKIHRVKEELLSLLESASADCVNTLNKSLERM